MPKSKASEKRKTYMREYSRRYRREKPEIIKAIMLRYFKKQCESNGVIKIDSKEVNDNES